MIVIVLVTAALFARLAALVAAVPQQLQRDNSCAWATVTVTAPSQPSDPNDNFEIQTVTVQSTITVTLTTGRGPSASQANGGSQGIATPGGGPQVVTVTSTLTIVSTIYPSQGPVVPAATARPLNSDPGSGSDSGPQVVTVTVTSTSVRTERLVSTETIYQSQTVTQIQTITQTLSLAGVQGGNQAVSGDPNGQQVAGTFLSALPSVLALPTPAADPLLPSGSNSPLQPLNRPYYGNNTSQFSNSTNSTAAAVAPQSAASPFLSSSVANSPGTSANPPSSGYQNSLYFANWAIYGAKYLPQSLPASSVTRINYAFADVQSDGTVVSSDTWADTGIHWGNDSWSEPGNNAYGCVKQLYLLKQQNRGLKLILAIGGWTWSSKFPPIAADPTRRATFASSAVKLVTDWGFDGVDIDWEFNAYDATAADAANIVLLLQAVRNAFDAWAAAHAPEYHFLVTVASPAGPAVYGLWDLAAMNPYVDSWNLMAYDYAGAWSTAAGHQANVYFDSQNPAATPYSTDQAVGAYVAAGVAASKIILGLPLYGRAFEDTRGLGRPYDGVGAGDSLGAGQWRLKDLPRPGAAELFDDVAKASYSYDPALGELISYDNLRSSQAKSAYLIGRGLGGAMFWEASDDRDGADSLVVAMAGQLGSLSAALNLLSYPTSQYDNIRNGLPGL